MARSPLPYMRQDIQYGEQDLHERRRIILFYLDFDRVRLNLNENLTLYK